MLLVLDPRAWNRSTSSSAALKVSICLFESADADVDDDDARLDCDGADLFAFCLTDDVEGAACTTSTFGSSTTSPISRLEVVMLELLPSVALVALSVLLRRVRIFFTVT